ncbi:MAG: aldehyde ferredoxin oxidoreductase [Syntrophomonadaceae bacterium]|nr:aldehyde ferredoxin oxidoreductase [Syntrophomonadaceae bacterium]
MGLILRVNVGTGVIAAAPPGDEYMVLGGRSLTSRIVADEVPPTCHPLSAHNKLVIAAGLFAGTMAPSGGRISIGAKSPLTGGIKEANGGGETARKLARLGYRAIIIEGKPQSQELFILKIDRSGAALIPGEKYREMGNYQLAASLLDEYGNKVAIISNGPLGERLASSAGITNTDREGVPSRFCGRGGLGAVMGSKGVKAIVIDDSGASEINFHDQQEFKSICQMLYQKMTGHPSMEAFAKFGTAGVLNYVNEVGGLPTRNFRTGRFEQAMQINGDKLRETILARGGEGDPSHACMTGCIIKCSNIYPDQNGKALVSPLEFETLGLLGSNLGIGDLDTIARMNYVCNDLGVDTIEIGVAIGVAMEAGIIPFGDGPAAEKMLEEVRQGTALGRVIAEGALITGRVFGVERVPVVKGQGMPAYDPRAVKGNGVTYATSPMGADHTAANTIRGKDHHIPEGRAAISSRSQAMIAAYDSLGFCVFTGAVINENLSAVARMATALTGQPQPDDYMYQLGVSVLKNELEFNRQAGFTKVHDRIPGYMLEEKLPPNDLVFDVTLEDLDNVHNR